MVAAVVSAPRRASAWCRTTTNVQFVPTAAKACDDSKDWVDTDGVRHPTLPIYWSSRCLGFSVQRDASVQADLPTARALVLQAFSEWSKVDCPTDPVACTGAGAGKPSIQIRDLGPVICDHVEYNGKVGNANLITFRDAEWPHDDPDVTLALTTVTFSVDSGEIFDADMEINSNPKVNQLTYGDPSGHVVYDLESMLTHESGHFLGLAHTQPSNTAATMYPRYIQGKTFMRDPSQDDVCAICAAYPPDRKTICNDTPKNGFAIECGGGDTTSAKKGCHCSVVGGEAGAGDFALAGCALAMTIGLVRRRARGRARR